MATGSEDLTEVELDTITKVSEEEEEAGSDEEEVSKSNLMVMFLGEMLQDM